MFDRELLVADIKNIIWSLQQISTRFQVIQSSDDFLKDDTGLEKLDSICMQLINIGEVLKQIDKLTDSKLLVNYPEIDWKKAKGMRDIITHHYFDIDAETIYAVCEEHVPEMKNVMVKILRDLENEE
ncbi:MAG: HepT-like ribonuclease domain-containing protein [Desulfuromonadaceae bacterium]